MVHQCVVRVIAVVGLALVLVGCGKTVVVKHADGTSVEMPAAEYRAQQAEGFMMNFQNGLSGLLQDCDPADRNTSEGEYRDCVHNNQLVLVQVPYMLERAASVNAGYWNLAAKKEDRPFRIANTVFQGIQTLGYAGLLPWGPGVSSGGNTFKITSRDQGTVAIRGLTTGNKSPNTEGSDNLIGIGSAQATEEALAANRDGQNIGEGTQGVNQQQVGTDPIPGTNFDGGEGDQIFEPNSSTEAGAQF